MDDITPTIRTRSWLWPAFKGSLFAVVLWYVGRRGWEVWRDAPPGALQIEWVWLVAALVAYLLGWLPSVWFWRAMLLGCGSAPHWSDAVRAYYVGHLGKYVPGKATVLVIRAALLGEVGLPPGVSAVTAMYETLATMGAGAGIAVALSPYATSPTLWQALPTWLQLLREQSLLMPVLVLAGTLVGLPVIARLFTVIAARMTPPSSKPATCRPGHFAAEMSVGDRGDTPGLSISAMTLLKGLVMVSGGWCLFAVSLGCVLKALGADIDLVAGFPVCLAAVTLSTVGGFVILIAPGGLGVREMLLVEVLQSQPGIAPAQAFVAAWLLRGVWLGGELLAAAVLWWRPRRAVEDPAPRGAKPQASIACGFAIAPNSSK